MIVITIILTRVTADSSQLRPRPTKRRAINSTYSRSTWLACQTIDKEYAYNHYRVPVFYQVRGDAAPDWRCQKNLKVYVTRIPRPISGANSLIKDR